MPTPGSYGATKGPSTKARPADEPDARTLKGALLRNGRLASTEESRDVLEEGDRAWQSLAQDRERRRKARDYLFGDQWGETITTPDGETKTERRAIEEQGREPWEMNRVRPIIRNLKGQLRQNESDRQVFAVDREDTEAAQMMTHALREARKINRLNSLEAQAFVEHLLAGKACFRVNYRYIDRYDRSEVDVETVNTLRLFYNNDLNDRRARDLRIIGELHDMELEEVKNAFAPRDPELAEAIEAYYGTAKQRTLTQPMSGFHRHDGLNFRTPTNTDLCRVIEAWRRESHTKRIVHDHEAGKLYDVTGRLTEEQIQRENAARQKAGEKPLELTQRRERVWVGYYLTPTGEILWSGETPYAHDQHPYVLGFGDFLDGEVRGLMHDLIDQQRLYNRMVQIMDLGLSTAARGVLMIPEEMVPEGMTPDDFADEWTKANGTIVYQATQDSGEPLPAQHTPEQVFSNSIPAGAFDWLAKMDEEMKQASGVMGPQMGADAKSDTPASLYNQQIVQSQTTNLDQFETFFETLRDLDVKIVQVAAHRHTDGRPLRRGSGDEDAMRFDKERAQKVEFDVATAQVTDTATYRQLFEQDLKEFLGGGLLTFQQFLKTSSHPKAESLLELIERTNPLVAETEGQGQQQGPQQGQGGQQAGGSGQLQEAVQTMRQGARAAGRQPQNPRQLRAQLVRRAENGDRDAKALLAQAA